MNYREAGLYTNRSTLEIRTEFEDIIAALREARIAKDITIDLIDFWLYGTTPPNYKNHLSLLNPDELLKREGILGKYIDNALSESSPIDKYVLFKNVCLFFVGENTTPDFKELVINPIMELLIKPNEKNKEKRLEQLNKGRATIKTLSGTISKAVKELQKIKPYHIAGTDVESILIDLEQIEHRAKEINE